MNMNWENREVTKESRCIRLSIAGFSMLVVAFIYWVFATYGMTANTWFSMLRYPNGIDCNLYNQLDSFETLQLRASA